MCARNELALYLNFTVVSVKVSVHIISTVVSLHMIFPVVSLEIICCLDSGVSKYHMRSVHIIFTVWSVDIISRASEEHPDRCSGGCNRAEGIQEERAGERAG